MSSYADRPNILIIITHDLGTRLSCYGESSVQTPALDSLAASGVRFANHFCTAPYCSPSRGAIFTGKYPHTNGLMGLTNLNWDLPDANATLARILGSDGYETFLLGFQHEVRGNERLNTYFQHVSERALPHDCDTVADLATSFLTERGSSGHHTPFYARVGTTEVHRPYDGYEPDDPTTVDVPPYMKDTPGAREDLAHFHGAIRRTDRSVGRILEALERSGLAENTIVVFTTDHGIAFPRAKATLYDPGIRTALLLRWPTRVPTNHRVDDMITNIDLLPSLLDAAGIALPPDLQGRSFLPLLVNQPYTPHTQVFAELNTVPGDVKRCVRTARYKLIRNYDEGALLQLPTDIESSPTRRDMGDDHLASRPVLELYDLELDPWEVDSLAGLPRMRQVEMDLTERLDRWLYETDDPILRDPITRPDGEAEILQKLWRIYGGQFRNPAYDRFIAQ